MRLTDFTSYADAQAHFSRDALWDLVDGSRERINIAYECIDRHPPERTAIRIAFADGRDEAYTFAEIAAWSSRFAHFLGREGVRPGERVAIFLEPSLTFYVALFGAMKAGAVAVPMFTLLGRDAIAARIDDCRPCLTLASAPLDGARTIVADDGFLAALRQEPDEFEARTAASDLAMYQYTSGTTRALPEAVRHRHRAVVTVLIAALYATGGAPARPLLLSVLAGLGARALARHPWPPSLSGRRSPPGPGASIRCGSSGCFRITESPISLPRPPTTG